MDKGLFANDGSFMERFKQMQQEMQEKEKAASAAASSAAPKPVDPKQGIAVTPNKRPFELKKAGPVGSGGKLAFSLKKAKVAVAPFFAPDDEDEDAADVEREEPAKRQKSVDAPASSAPTGAVGNHLFICFIVVILSLCCTFCRYKTFHSNVLKH
uniref:Gamma response I protein n=1 Tax=Arundo donax TaxID=35708 RepID=A0A0A9A8X1_ARUDO